MHIFACPGFFVCSACFYTFSIFLHFFRSFKSCCPHIFPQIGESFPQQLFCPRIGAPLTDGCLHVGTPLRASRLLHSQGPQYLTCLAAVLSDEGPSPPRVGAAPPTKDEEELEYSFNKGQAVLITCAGGGRGRGPLMRSTSRRSTPQTKLPLLFLLQIQSFFT